MEEKKSSLELRSSLTNSHHLLRNSVRNVSIFRASVVCDSFPKWPGDSQPLGGVGTHESTNVPQEGK